MRIQNPKQKKKHTQKTVAQDNKTLCSFLALCCVFQNSRVSNQG